MISLPGIGPLQWLAATGDAAVEASVDADSLTMRAGARTDWFNDPVMSTHTATAPALVFPAGGDFQLSATVTVDFLAMFDAGVLFVHHGADDWAKLCFERSPLGTPTVVSVVTRGESDDANGPAVDGNSVRLRISRIGKAWAFHSAVVDSGAGAGAGAERMDHWHLARLFALRDTLGPVRVGFLAQSPTGDGCTVRFDRAAFSATTLADPRDGS